MRNTKCLVLAALCVALGIVLPIAFHSIPNAGRIFAPMHIPVLLAGLVSGPVYGLIVGVLTPVLSSLLTGMPPTPVLPAMTAELAVFGFGAGLLMHLLQRMHYVPAVYLSLLGAMLAGRVVAGVLNALIFQLGAYSFEIWIASYFVTSLPGILIHLITVPHICFALRQVGVIVPLREAVAKTG